MTPKQIHELATITARHIELHEAAKTVAAALNTLLNRVFLNTLSNGEDETLRDAIDIADKIAHSHSIRDAIFYYETIQRNEHEQK